MENEQTHFYLIDNNIMMSLTPVPSGDKYKHNSTKYYLHYNAWVLSLKKCKIVESELNSILLCVYPNKSVLIDVTHIVNAEYDGHYENIIITFKDPNVKVENKEADQIGMPLEYWKTNAEENYITTPISVLKYITVLEEALAKNK